MWQARKCPGRTVLRRPPASFGLSRYAARRSANRAIVWQGSRRVGPSTAARPGVLAPRRRDSNRSSRCRKPHRRPDRVRRRAANPPSPLPPKGRASVVEAGEISGRFRKIVVVDLAGDRGHLAAIVAAAAIANVADLFGNVVEPLSGELGEAGHHTDAVEAMALGAGFPR